MILVTLGTQKQEFTRLLDYIEKSNINDEIIVQCGNTKYKSKKMKLFDFISYDEMEKYIKKADLIITHGGTGSIIGPLKKGKKVIACSRQKEYGEHVDNHQEEIVDILSEEGYILKLDDDIKLDDLIKKIESFKPKKFNSNSKKFIEKLHNKINEIESEEEVISNKLTKFINNVCYVFLFIFSLLSIFAIFDKRYTLSFILENSFLILLVFIFFKYFTRMIIKLFKKYDIYIIGLLCVLVRIIWIKAVKVEPKVDYLMFYNVAKELANGTLIDNLSVVRHLSIFPHIFGYSSFISIFYMIFGVSPLISQYVNIGLSLISMIIIFNIGKICKDRKMGIIAATMWSCLPSQIIFNSQVLSEPLYTTIMLFAIYLFIFYIKKRTNLSNAKNFVILMLIGILCGWGNTIRPVFIIFMIALFIYIVFYLIEDRFIKRICQFLIIFVFYIGTSGILNQYMEYKIGAEISSFPGYSMYVGFNEKSDGLFDSDAYALMKKYSKNQELSASEVHEKMFDDLLNKLKTENINYSKLFLIQKHRSMWMSDDVCLRAIPNPVFYGKTEIGGYSIYVLLQKLCNTYYFALIIFSLLGIKYLKKNKYLIIPVLYVIGLWLAHSLFLEVAIRYHYSGVAMLVILSSYFVRSKLGGKE